MERKEFIRICCMSCAASGLIPALLESCAVLNIPETEGEIVGSDLVLDQNAFFRPGKKLPDYSPHVIVRNEFLQYPICVFRSQAGDYTAYLMKCTHQGSELQLFGEMFQCPAHGSEFNTTGKVIRGPAESELRTFPVVIDNENIKISLK